MSSSPTLPGTMSPSTTDPETTTSTASAPAAAPPGPPSSSPSTPAVPPSTTTTTTTGDRRSSSSSDDDEASGNGADLPMTMAASVILTSLPKDAKSALEGVGVGGGGRDVAEFAKGAKVNVRFRAVGSAPALRKPVAQVSPTSSFVTVVKYLRRVLRLQEHEGVFCYVNSVFAPGLDEGVGNLWRCFKVNDELVVAYSITPAFG